MEPLTIPIPWKVAIHRIMEITTTITHTCHHTRGMTNIAVETTHGADLNAIILTLFQMTLIETLKALIMIVLDQWITTMSLEGTIETETHLLTNKAILGTIELHTNLDEETMIETTMIV